MKVINIVVASLVIVLIAQSFLTACPTCLNQVNHDSIGEMENHIELGENYQNYNDFFQDYQDSDESVQDGGFTDYDEHILGVLDNE